MKIEVTFFVRVLHDILIMFHGPIFCHFTVLLFV